MPAPGILVRAARPEDAPAIHRVHEASIRSLGPAAYTPEDVESWAAGLRTQGYAEAIASGTETMVVALLDGRIVGFGSLKPLEINAVYVAPEAVRRGVGSALLRDLETRARAQGRGRVRVTATLVGRPFYEARGYRETDRRKHPTRGGRPVDVVIMEKDLAGDGAA